MSEYYVTIAHQDGTFNVRCAICLCYSNRVVNLQLNLLVKAAKIPELVQYFSTVGTIKEDKTTKRPRLVTQL